MNVKIIAKLFHISIIALYLLAAIGCAPTIFRTPKTVIVPTNKLAIITIPKNVLLMRINDHRFGRCYADVAKKCAVQLVSGDYVFDVKIIESSIVTKKYEPPAFSHAENPSYNSNITLIGTSILRSNVSTISMTIREDTYYGLYADKGYNINMIEYKGNELEKVKDVFKSANIKDLRLSSNKIFGYVIK